MKFAKFLTFSLFTPLFYFSVSAQNNNSVLNQIMDKSAKAYADIPVEKVYLHFDKPYYAVDDTIWFKAYVTLGNHQLSAISKVVYVDIIAPHDSLAQGLKLQVKNGVAWGNITLSQNSFKKGNYRVIAFTNFMNNTGVSYFFNKNITIGDAVNNQVSAQISLKSGLAGKFRKIFAGIYYKDDDGSPYHDKKVSWEIQKDGEALARGKGVTDKKGFIDISYVNNKNLQLDSTSLVTEIDNGPRKVVSNSFSLRSITRPNDMQFFPEGGQLIVGIRTKVAFKAVKPDGLSIDVKGTITDNNNNVVTVFSSSHLGMGVFILTPEDGKTYTAHVNFTDGTAATPDFPKVGSDGVDLSLDNNDPDNLNFKLQADAAFLKDFEGKTFFILAKSSAVIYFAAKLVLQSTVYNAAIPKNKFPTGIVQVTLFTGDGEPISERVAFIQHNDQINLAINSDHPVYDFRQKVKLGITAKSNGQPDEGNFSISVIDEAKVPFDEDAESTILTNLLLTSDIKGYIEKPNYYFNQSNQKAIADLDVLLQTQGYRRFSYDDILNNKQKAIKYGAEQGLNIIGTLRGANGIPINNGNVHLSVPDKNFSANAVTNTEGRFIFSNLVFLDSAKVILNARDNVHASTLVLTVDGEQRQNLPVNYNLPDEVTNIDSMLSVYLKNSKIQYNSLHQLKEVVIKDTRIVQTASHRDYSSLASLGEADHVIKGGQFNGCPNFVDCLKSLAPGMTFQENNFYVFRDYNAGKKIPAQVFVRGMPVDVNFLAGIDAANVESVEIFYKDELGLVNSQNNSNGAIVINLKKAEKGSKISYQDLKQLIGTRNEITYLPKGYEVVKTFYLPRYTIPKNNQQAISDRRSTIYWNPNVIIDKTGNATLEYYNADGQGTYRVTIEGIDKDGNLGRQVYRYMVK